MTFFSALLTPTTSPQLVLANKPFIQNVTQISIVVRSMGTATYIGIGGSDAQDRRLTTVGDSISIDTPLGYKYVNVSSLFVVSDTADAVIEVIGDAL